MNIKIILKFFIIVFLATTCAILIAITVKNHNAVKEKPETYKIKIDDDVVYLFADDEIIKKYDIDISVLPGNDIEILIKGIEVNSVSEADRIAEDYDG